LYWPGRSAGSFARSDMRETVAVIRTNVQVLEPGKKFKFNFPDCLQQGDILSISVDGADKKLMALNVGTCIDKPGDKVVFDVVYNWI
jgi:hypothetical protein